MNEFFGKLLIASPRLDSTSFARSVVYVFQDNEDATVGVVLNQPANQEIERAWEGIVGSYSANGFPSVGGPLPGPLVALHQDAKAAEITLPNGIYTCATEDNIHYLVSQQENAFRVFFGLSGWQQGQLATEVNEGIWLATKPSADLLFGKSQDLWADALLRFQNRFIHDVLGIKGVPENVLDN